MEWTSVLIGFGGLLLGALTTLLAYMQRRDERTSKYREALYAKQIEASIEIMEIATEHLRRVRDIVEMQVDRDELADAITEAYEGRIRIRVVHDKWIVFIPKKLHEVLNSFSRKTYNVVQAVASLGEDEFVEENLVGYQLEVKNSYYPLVEEVRNVLGTDPLTTETSDFFGK